MLRNFQTDKRWSNESMGLEGDTLGKYGCFVTAMANILEITPLELNNTFKKENVYLGKKFPNEESEIDYMKARRATNTTFRRLLIKEIDTVSIEQIILVIESDVSPSGVHYVNCLLDNFNTIKIFDVYNGNEYFIDKNKIIGAYALYK